MCLLLEARTEGDSPLDLILGLDPVFSSFSVNVYYIFTHVYYK